MTTDGTGLCECKRRKWPGFAGAFAGTGAATVMSKIDAGFLIDITMMIVG